MIHTYRYKWNGVNITHVNRLLSPLFPAVFLVTGPSILVDVSADDSAKADLDDAMGEQGWSFESQDPVGTGLSNSSIVRRILETRVGVDTTTTSTVFVDLLSIVLTTDAGFLEIESTVASNSITVLSFIRVALDGVSVPDSETVQLVGDSSSSILKRVAVTAGTHTVSLQWRTTILGTLQVRPVTNPQEHATLLIREVS